MSATRIINSVDMQQVIEYLRKNLVLHVKTQSHYVGDIDGGDRLYQDSHEISLILGDEVISLIHL